MNLCRTIAVALAALSLSSCMSLVRIDNPMEDLHEISIVPVTGRSLEETKLWTNRLRENLLRVDEIDRVVIMYGDDLTQPEAPPELPMAVTSQALFRLRLLDFDGYYPPSASVEIDLYIPGSSDSDKDTDGMRLDERGSRSATVRLLPARHRMTFQLPVRIDDPEVSNALDLYAMAASDDDRGFDARDRLVWTKDRFVDFVAFYSIRKAFHRLEEQLQERLEETPPPSEPTLMVRTSSGL